MNDVNKIPASCQPIVPGESYETTYFKKFLPCIYDWGSTPYYAIVPTKISKKIRDPFTQEGLKTFRERMRDLYRNSISPENFSKSMRTLIKQAPTSIVSPWIYTGKPHNNPHWGFGIEYAQKWTSKGFKQGRIIDSAALGLYPATKEVSIKTWVKKTDITKFTESIESAMTKEISTDEKWTLSTKKLFAQESGSTFNPSATINKLSIPVTESLTVGAEGNLGISGELSNQLKNSTDRGREYIQTNTIKATDSLKITRNSSVEQTYEAGEERNSKETLSNPNINNTLNYLYYEVLEDIEIETKPLTLDLYLFIPLRVEEINNEWLLRYECVLRPLLKCEALRAGFDAAKRELIFRELEKQKTNRMQQDLELTSELDSEKIEQAKKLDRAISRVIDTYHLLTGESPESGPGSWVYWSFVDALAKPLRDALGVLDEQYRDLSEEDRKSIIVLGGLLDEFFSTLGPVDDAFFILDVLVAAGTGYAHYMAAIITSGLSIIVSAVLLILAEVGFDVDADDEGLRSKINSLNNKYKAFIVSASSLTELPAPNGDGVMPTYSELTQRQMISDAATLSWVEAQVESKRLKEHIQDHLTFYYQVIWSNLPQAIIEEYIEEAGISHLVEHTFSGFQGQRAACRVTANSQLISAGIDLEKLKQEVFKDSQHHDDKYRYIVTVPTPGVIVEPLLGTCDGGDRFIGEHREQNSRKHAVELGRSEQELEMAKLEVARYQARLDTEDYSDPSRVQPRIGVDIYRSDSESG
jgi:hypothetical protein